MQVTIEISQVDQQQYLAELFEIYEQSKNPYEAYEKLYVFAEKGFGIAWENDTHILQKGHKIININI